MALIYEKGTLAYKSEVKYGTSKAGREWATMTIVVDIPGFQGAFRKIALNVQTDEINDVQALAIGSKVEVGYQVSAREWQGRWYNNVDLHTIRPEEESKPAPTPKSSEESLEPQEGDLPW